MELSTTQQILVIFLSTALAIFLVLSIIIAAMVIRLLKTLRLIAGKAEKLVESAEAVGHVFKTAAGPLGIFRFLHGVMDMVRAKQDKDNKEQ
jgi:uncharacterized metal-binding protein